jgi:hypothetical protein
MRRFMVLVTVSVLLAAMLVAFAGPAAWAQGGCQAFGHSVAEDAQEFQPLGQNFVSGAAPLNDEALTEHEQLCG